MESALKPEVFRKLYKDFAAQNPKWNEIPSSTGNVYEWDGKSTYIQEPPFFENFSMTPGSIQPDHRRAGARHFWRQRDDRSHLARRRDQEEFARRKISFRTTASQSVDFNSYGSRRGNDRIMTRGTFANVRIKNLMVRGVEGECGKSTLNVGRCSEDMGMFKTLR